MEPPSTIIETVDQLKQYLQVALQLEHATIPPYLTAAYAANAEVNRPSIDIIRAVAKEEMLHLTFAANLLNAIGGSPDLVAEGFVPRYPTHLPTGQDDFEVGIETLCDHALEIFLAIERPTSLQPEHEGGFERLRKTVSVSSNQMDLSIFKAENTLVPIRASGEGAFELQYDIAVVPHHRLTTLRKSISEAGRSLVPRVPALADDGEDIELHYWSIGEFYKAIHLGFVELTLELGAEALFCGDPRRQVDPKYYYSAGGDLTMVTDLTSALKAIDFIASQGEGGTESVYDPGGELAHYYRFDQIRQRRYYRDPNKDGTGDAPGHPTGGRFPVDMAAVFPVKANAKVADYAGHPELQRHARLFNGRYQRFLGLLTQAFNGHPEMLGSVFTSEMFAIKDAMERLVRHPLPGTAFHAAPTFEMDEVLHPDTVPKTALKGASRIPSGPGGTPTSAPVVAPAEGVGRHV